LKEPDDQTLREILARLAVSGADEDAWSELYRKMWPFVFGIVYRRLRGVSGMAEDISQDVFLRLFRARPFARLQDPDSFRAYLARIAQNTTNSYLRQVLRTHTFEINGEAATQTSEPGLQDDTIERIDTFRSLKEELPSTEKKLFELVLSGLSVSEIAKTLGTSYGAAAVRLYRLRKRLRSS
jgi:RNA polymerase sigma-70 factor (ECF subfamily)